MISDDAILSGVHAMIDRLQDCGDVQDYYQINHVSAADIQRLTRIVRVWLMLVKVEVESEVRTDGLQEKERQG